MYSSPSLQSGVRTEASCLQGFMMKSLVALILVMSSCIQVARGTYQDGNPRPLNIPDTPAVAWGKLPAAVDLVTLKTAACDWYGWINVNNQADAGSNCMAYLWNVEVQILAAVQTEPIAFQYYKCSNSIESTICWDRTANDYICTIGCFDLSNTTLRLPSVTNPPSPTPPGPTFYYPPKPSGGTFQQPSVLLLGWAVAGAVAVIFHQHLGGAS